MDWSHTPLGPDTGTDPDGDLAMVGSGFDDGSIMHTDDDQVPRLDDDNAAPVVPEPPSMSTLMPHAPNESQSRESYPHNFNFSTSSSIEGTSGVPRQDTRAASEPPSISGSGAWANSKDRHFERKAVFEAARSAGIQKTKPPKKPLGRQIIMNQDARLAHALEQMRLAKDADGPPKQDGGNNNDPQGGRIEHPLRRLLLNLPGYAFGTELDAVRFRRAGLVVVGVEEFLPAAGGGSLWAALQWLVRFLLLAFRTRRDFLRRHPGCRDVDQVQGGYALVAVEMRGVVKKYNSGNNSGASGAGGSREKMELRLAQGMDVRDLVRWTALARRRFLTEGERGRPVEEVPGFEGYGPPAREVAPTLSETQLWELIDEENAAIWNEIADADAFMGLENLTFGGSST
ncbi:hypothetical protein CSOJ01_15106 [Colletotrichum sojae]|uniref:Uncharacterized protein n=1 Tax=Colletotrichum sojae TaxID=2175907 RepID=A0A8H6IP08_9PEZI|nr:hypothetical protein CSOJ01_15106 [Colletotrichum sojae]